MRRNLNSSGEKDVTLGEQKRLLTNKYTEYLSLLHLKFKIGLLIVFYSESKKKFLLQTDQKVAGKTFFRTITLLLICVIII